MKKILLFITSAICMIALCSCGDTSTSVEAPGKQPLNVVVYIDLSDRIMDNVDDCDIIWWISKKMFPTKFPQGNKNKLRCVVYPNPGNTESLSCLNVNLQSMKPMERLGYVYKLDSGKVFVPEVKDFYAKSIASKNWTGSDEWGFFDLEASNYLIPGYRNVFVVLTDGYIYEKNNIGPKENQHLYRNMYKCLKDSKGEIEPITKNYNSAVEVISMELVKKDYNTYQKMVQKRESWYKSMGIVPYSISKGQQNKYDMLEQIFEF